MAVLIFFAARYVTVLRVYAQICNLIYQLIIVDFLMRVLVEGAKWIL